MKKLSRKQEIQKQELAEKMAAAKEGLEVEINAYNGVLQEAWERLEEALSKLNEAIQEAEEFRVEIAGAQEEYYDERSERWQEGDAGQAYQAWKQDWEMELSEVEMEQPDDLEMPDAEAIDNFELLNDEP
jgi:hypothetical protein